MKTTLHLHALSESISLHRTLQNVLFVQASNHVHLKYMTYVQKNLVSQRKPSLLLQDEKERKVKSLSRVQLFTTPWTVTYQAPLSMGFSGQEH